MRLDSPFVLALAGTLALHTLIVVGADAVVVTNPPRPRIAAPRVELVDIEVPRPLPPPPPPVARQPEPAPVREEAPKRTAPRQRVAAAQPPPRAAEPPPPASPDPGGAPTVAMDDIAPAATGVPVARGARSERVGRGGRGRGTGSGDGQGGGDPAPAPVSIATIKTRAMPKGDYGFFEAGKDYPTEARQLGVEGVIRVRLIVDDQGRVKSAILLNKLGHGLDELAMARARQIQFEPARDTDDKAVNSVVVWTFNMTLPK